MATAPIVLDLLDPDNAGAVDVTHRGGVLRFDTEADALAFVARRLADRPGTPVQVRVR